VLITVIGGAILVGLTTKESNWHGAALQQSLNALLNTSTMGVALCDRRLRFRAVNEALASMNGVKAEAHIGHTVRDVIGPAAPRVEAAFRHVFATGLPLLNFELSARLPQREGIGHWVENYYPIKDKSGKVYQVGAIVLEVTKRKNAARRLRRLTKQLRQATQALNTNRPASPRTEQLAAASSLCLELLNACVSETEAIAALLKPQLRLTAARHDQIVFHPGFEVFSPEENLIPDFDSQIGLRKPQVRKLSDREHQLLQLLAVGKSNKEMADILNLSVRTVETYRARVMLKINVRSLAELVQYAVRNNII
jgi:PAS domain S-box-containing protein